MAVAVALTTQCPYCIELHMREAREAGANDTMLTEAAIVAAAMRANASVALIQRVTIASRAPSASSLNRLSKGGHFAAWEQLQVFSEEVRAGFRTLRIDVSFMM
jgi:AhpD family alkylhydroperoxidase